MGQHARNEFYRMQSQRRNDPGVLTIYAPMIYTAPCIMFWIRAYPLRGKVGGGSMAQPPSF